MIRAGLEFRKVGAGRWSGGERWLKPNLYSVERHRGALGNYKGTRIRKAGSYWYWVAYLDGESVGRHFRTMQGAAEAIQQVLEERKEE